MNKKGKTKRTTVFILLGVGILFFLVIGPKLGLFSILPTGQYNVYPECKFVTNVDPLKNSYNDYKTSAAWMAIDINNDGVKEKFGWAAEGFCSTPPCSKCNTGLDASAGDYTLLFADFTNRTASCTGGEQDDIYYSNINGYSYLYVCSCTGMMYQRFTQNYGAASNAIIPNECLTQQCNGAADTNCDGNVDRTEIGIYINKWINGQVTRAELGTAIMAWIIS